MRQSPFRGSALSADPKPTAGTEQGWLVQCAGCGVTGSAERVRRNGRLEDRVSIPAMRKHGRTLVHRGKCRGEIVAYRTGAE